jgi:hypothetical protein
MKLKGPYYLRPRYRGLAQLYLAFLPSVNSRPEGWESTSAGARWGDVRADDARISGESAKTHEESIPPDSDGNHLQSARVLRFLHDWVCAGLHRRAMEANVRPIGCGAPLIRNRLDARRGALGLARGSDWPPQGPDRHCDYLLLRHRHSGAHPREGLDFFEHFSLRCWTWRRRPLFSHSAAGAGIRAHVQAWQR